MAVRLFAWEARDQLIDGRHLHSRAAKHRVSDHGPEQAQEFSHWISVPSLSALGITSELLVGVPFLNSPAAHWSSDGAVVAQQPMFNAVTLSGVIICAP